MNAMTQDFWQEQADEPPVRIDGRVNPDLEDAYWQSVYWGESYYRSDLDYEDYAPAYCVGYCGYAQYGGRFQDAEKSLCANWERIRGESRLSLDEAMQAIRAAWHHAEHGRVEVDTDEEDLIQLPVLARGNAATPAYASA